VDVGEPRAYIENPDVAWHDDTVSLTWSGVDGVSFYNVYVSTGSDLSRATILAQPAGASYTTAALTAGVNYNFWVEGVYADGTTTNTVSGFTSAESSYTGSPSLVAMPWLALLLDQPSTPREFVFVGENTFDPGYLKWYSHLVFNGSNLLTTQNFSHTFVFHATDSDNTMDNSVTSSIYQAGLAFDGTNVFVSGIDNVLYRLDPYSLAVVGQTSLPDSQMRIVSNGVNIFAIKGTSAYRLDGNGSILDTYGFPPIDTVDLTWDGRHFWAIGSHNDTIYQLGIKDGAFEIVATYVVAYTPWYGTGICFVNDRFYIVTSDLNSTDDSKIVQYKLQ
jgi:hypothetical protein